MQLKLRPSYLTIFLVSIFTQINIWCDEDSQNEREIAKQEYSSSTLFELWQKYLQDKSFLDRFYKNLKKPYIIDSSQQSDNEVTIIYFSKGSPNTDFIMLSGGPDFFG
ncbi:hypothetical protein [Pleionea sediminis]|uniref:hypothetical protein n=1 Tax=Pleionea sediminis TaxID=2569479 RepID=UPI00118652E9|nr:hypothetical protein [Pleionea sediminis]